MDAKELLKELTEAIGASGHEEEVRDIVHSHISGVVDSIDVDALGNIVAVRANPDSPRVMVAAHMDEVGLMVRYIETTGFLRVAPLGGWDARALPGQEVVISAPAGQRVWGVIGVPSPHITTPEERDRVIPVEELFVDLGAASREEAEARGIRVGTPVVPYCSFRSIEGNYVVGKALDNRAGCALLVLVLERLANTALDVELAAVFTTQEEVGQRGATVAGYRLAPDVVLAVEGPAAGDFPGVDPHRVPLTVGKGPALTIADRNLLAHRGLFSFMEQIAEKRGIPLQIKMPALGGTDAGAVQRTREGAMAGVLSIPCRYTHTTRSVMSMDDFDHGLELLVGCLGEVGKWLQEEGRH